METNDLTEPINNVANQISNVNTTIGFSTNETSKSINGLKSTLMITNIFLGVLILAILLNTFIKWKNRLKK